MKGKLIIDEVQYAPKLFSYIKMEVDNSKEKGKFWLTSNQYVMGIKMIKRTCQKFPSCRA